MTQEDPRAQAAEVEAARWLAARGKSFVQLIVRDGDTDAMRMAPMNAPDGFPAGHWVVIVRDEGFGMVIGSSRAAAVEKASGQVVWYGSLRDEG